MMHIDRDALLCDLAETYHVYDLRVLPLLTVAALSVGLRDDSRIKMKMLGRSYISPMMLLSTITDELVTMRLAYTELKDNVIPGGYTEIFSGTAQAARAAKEKNKDYVEVRNSIFGDAIQRTQEVTDGG